MLFTGESIGLSVFFSFLRDKVNIYNAFYFKTAFLGSGVQ